MPRHRGVSQGRRGLLAAGAIALATPGLAKAVRLPRVGYLLLTPHVEPPTRERQAFLDGLRDEGFAPGKAVDIVYRSAEGLPEFLDATCRDLLALEPDVIATSGALAVLAAKRATRTIPIVMLAVGDPVGIGAVASLSRPAANLTGVSFISSELAPKRLQITRECLPSARRIAILWDRRNPNAVSEAHAAREAAAQLGLEGEPVVLSAERGVAPALERLAASRPDVLYVAFEGGLVASHRTELAEFGLQRRLPIVSGWASLTEAGALFSYAPDIPAMFRRAAYHVSRLLRGTPLASLPIELPTRVELVMNRAAARQIGVNIPAQLLLRAERVID